MRSRTYIATPPGATIKEQLEDRGMSQKEFAARMGMSEKNISQLINGNVQLTNDTALKLEMVLGLPARFWNNLESIFREKLAKAQAENEMDQDKELAKRFPYPEMAKHRWVKETKDWTERVFELRAFFEVAQLECLRSPLVSNIAFRKLGDGEKTDYALLAWEQKARLEARKEEVGPINLDKLEKIAPDFRGMTTQNIEDFADVLKSRLAECGVALVIVPHIGGSFLHGASFYDGKKIVIGVTMRGKDADRFWFSLYHEIGHVILGHISNPEGACEEDELRADRYAQDTLINPESYVGFVAENNFEESAICNFAEQIGVDAGIVLGRLQKYGIVRFNQYGNLKRKYEL